MRPGAASPYAAASNVKPAVEGSSRMLATATATLPSGARHAPAMAAG
jgi:hypothetical protein